MRGPGEGPDCEPYLSSMGNSESVGVSHFLETQKRWCHFFLTFVVSKTQGSSTVQNSLKLLHHVNAFKPSSAGASVLEFDFSQPCFFSGPNIVKFYCGYFV